ncbi:MAG TPA: permease-like cell division protein FtsX, partial [Gemmatimonadales bacterium]|nr:permease-like cell division protein FtsX [Gemmatimonadales bacterium]
LTNLQRNALVVVSAVVAVLVTLTLFFSAAVVRWLIDQDIGRWDDNIRVIAFLNDDLSLDDVGALQEEIQSWEEVASVVYFSKADALNEFRELFADQPSLIEVVEEDPSTLPASLRVRPIEAGDYTQITNRLVVIPGVRQVSSADEAIDALVTRSSRLRTFSFWILIVLGGAAVVLIANTIRMAIYARRDEIGIMKLVGAGNWFVRIPFLVEGVIEGIVGALIAIGLVWILREQVVELFSTVADPDAINVPWDFLLRQSIMVLGFGAVTGLVGSAFGTWGFLRD